MLEKYLCVGEKKVDMCSSGGTSWFSFLRSTFRINNENRYNLALHLSNIFNYNIKWYKDSQYNKLKCGNCWKSVRNISFQYFNFLCILNWIKITLITNLFWNYDFLQTTMNNTNILGRYVNYFYKQFKH